MAVSWLGWAAIAVGGAVGWRCWKFFAASYLLFTVTTGLASLILSGETVAEWISLTIVSYGPTATSNQRLAVLFAVVSILFAMPVGLVRLGWWMVQHDPPDFEFSWLPARGEP